MSLPLSISLPSIVVILPPSPLPLDTHVVGALGHSGHLQGNFSSFFICVFWFFRFDFKGQTCVDFECLRNILKLKCGFWFFGGVGGQMYADFECLRHVLKPKSFVFVGFGLFASGGQMCGHVQLLMLESFIFVGFGFVEGVGQMHIDVECLMHILKVRMLYFYRFWFFEGVGDYMC